MDEIRQNVSSIYKNTMLGKIENMDSKMLNYWVNSINRKDKNLVDFQEFLLKSQDYSNIIRNTFMDVFYERLSENNYYELFDEFQKHYTDKKVDISDISSFITESGIFREKYHHVIVTVYEAMKGQEPSEQEVNSYLLKFKQNSKYDIDDLRVDISMATSPFDMDENICGDLSEEEQTEIFELWEDKAKFLEFYRSAKTAQPREILPQQVMEMKPTIENKSDNTLSIVDSFETIFKRNMNVREYLLYFDKLAKLNEKEKDTFIMSLKRVHDELFVNVQDILLRYLGSNLDEDGFIKNYLHRSNEENFIDRLKQDIILSDDYESKMKERLASLYKSLYDTTLDSIEASYLFTSIKNKGYDLLNEDLNNEIVSFKSKTDNIIERILNIFLDTFEREPDTYEVSKYLQIYRDNSSSPIADIDNIVEHDLQESLEFHDVIKKKIKKLYSSIHNSSIAPSIVYTLLKKVLDIGINNKTLETHIESLVQAL